MLFRSLGDPTMAPTDCRVEWADGGAERSFEATWQAIASAIDDDLNVDHPITGAAAGMGKAGSTDTEKLIAAFRGLSFGTPFGKVAFRAQDHQSTMGAFLGRTKNEGGKGVMVDYRYIDGAKVLPSDTEVKKLRPANP